VTAYTEPVTTARYDGQAAWYDAFASADVFTTVRRAAVSLLGDGPGRCLDLGCGTGRAVPLLTAAGWSVVGTDLSADQLELARTHAGELAEQLLLADAHALPFDDESFDGVVSILTHTDLDDLAGAFREVRRVLKQGGTFAYVGVHPCFGAPCIQQLEDGTSIVHPGYREPGWQWISRNPENPGIRSRVGINHMPLPTLLNTALESGLAIGEVIEPGDRDPPLFLGFRAQKR
jgi:SAM-dependent methyltransferase